MICNQCPRKCNIDRKSKIGYCKAPSDFKVARAALHYWEEPCISGKNGSGTVFFSGCNLGCVYCQNYEISQKGFGEIITEKQLVSIFENLIKQGANNINLVNPSHYAVQIANVLKKWKSPVPIVYNTSSYDDIETLKILDGLVDIYLADFKYILPEKAKKYSKAENYPHIAKQALLEMKKQIPSDVFDQNGIMQKGIIIRHLILPANTNASLKALDFLAKNYNNTYISLMAQYTPCGDLIGFDEINRTITKREYNKVVDYALNLGLEKIFIQELQSADNSYIPDFDLTGIIDFKNKM